MPFKPGNKLFLMPKRDRPPKPVLADLDGRTNIAKDARRIFGRIVADRGGLDQMSEAEIQLAKSAAVDCAFLQSRTADLFEGKTIDLPTFVMLQNAQRRALQAIGLKRVPRDVSPSSLDDIVREHEQEREAAEKDDSMS